MKKEKKIRTYQRRTKSGKMVTVKAHTAKYDAAEKAKELAKKKGAGDELEERKKKKTPQLELPFDENSEKDILNEVKEVEKKETKKSTKADTPKKEAKTKTATKTKATDGKTSEPAFTAAEFKEWYQGTGSAADKKVAKALRAQLGRSGYKKLEDEAIDNYTPRGHLSMFKRVSSDGDKSLPKTKNSTKGEDKSFSTVKELHKATKLDRFENGASLTGKQYSEAVKLLKDSGYKQVKDYLVPPKGKGPLYSVWHKKLSQAGYDDERDLYTGHDVLSKSQREIMGSLGYTAFKSPSKDLKTLSKVEEPKKKPATLHPHDYYEYTPSVRKKLDSLEAKIKESDAVWRSKFGSGRKGSEAERDKFLRSQNKLRDQYTKLLDSSTTETSKYKQYKKDLHSYYESERAREKESERATKREQMQRNKSLYEKYGTTRKEVVDYMRSGSRKWKWDSESDAFIATSKSIGRVYDSMSLESAIKRMMKAKATSGSTESKTKKSGRTKPIKKATSVRKLTPKGIIAMTTERDWIYGD